MTELIKLLESSNIRYIHNEPMKNHTSFKTGGEAELFIIPDSCDELSSVLSKCSELVIEPFILGNGSNLLISDDGIKGRPVIQIGKGFDFIRKISDDTLEIGAGTNLTAACRFALNESLSGLEFAFGIPGSCGGAAYMNAGAYGGEMKDVLVRVNHMDMKGNVGCFEGDELDLSYRHSVYSKGGYVITSVEVKLIKGDYNEIEAKMKDLIGRRKDKQPLEYPSAGSVFKRPEGYFAGALIEQNGLKGKRIGGAMVSEKHAGFIINYDNATTSDVVNLIRHCQAVVKENSGVELETEIKIID
ncbi:MAG: UDP-N-acetylmuramate dehydrogenase [Clostridia bacterium]|nr:UDP-N-acetylmuramate dehydrogenase [Clostridia bacterium]